MVTVNPVTFSGAKLRTKYGLAIEDYWIDAEGLHVPSLPDLTEADVADCHLTPAEIQATQEEDAETAALDAIADFRAFRRGMIRTIRHLVQSGQITLPLNLRQWWTDQATALLNPGDAGGNMKVGG